MCNLRRFQEVSLLPPSPPLPLPRVLGSQFLSCFDCNSLISPFGQKPGLAPSRPSGSQPHSHHCGKRPEPGLSRSEGHRQAGPTEGRLPQDYGEVGWFSLTYPTWHPDFGPNVSSQSVSFSPFYLSI
uniref:Uncharacterized protein n=1 Tax=Molossus molossus TaxID=27622 RepID=A0A7J8E2S6_MOLMO|nr:hypothetical protein HJG59_009076 [Molossus molossus]